jgi:hypothetical protein
VRQAVLFWMGVVLLAWTQAAGAQTDALVVDETGAVGVGTALLAPAESLAVSASLEAPFVKVPRKCQRRIPVRIVVADAATGDLLLSEAAMLPRSPAS